MSACPGRARILLSKLSDSCGVDAVVKLQSSGTFGCLLMSSLVSANQIVSIVKYNDSACNVRTGKLCACCRGHGLNCFCLSNRIKGKVYV